MESGWGRVSLSHQDTFGYSRWSWQFCDLDGLDSSSDFKFPQSPLKTILKFLQSPLRTILRAHTTIGINVTFMLHSFLVLWLALSICASSLSFIGLPEPQNPLDDKFVYYYYYHCYYSFECFSHWRYWWFFTGVWATASLLKSPRLFLVSWPMLKML